MDIKHLELFAAVARYGSINRAAQELYISQPHLSHIIRDMETELGASLFQRSKSGVSLTPEGTLFLQHAQVILREMEDLRSFSRRFEQQDDRLLVSMTRFSHTMESFNAVCSRHQTHPRFLYRLNEGSALDVIGEVADGLSDLGVINFAAHAAERMSALLEGKRLDFAPLARLTPHIVLSKNHPLLRAGRPVTLEALRDYGFVRYTGQCEDFLYNIATEGQQTDLSSSSRIIYVHGRSALMHLISVSNFYTIGIQNFSAQEPMYQCVSIPIPDCVEQIQFGLISRRGESVSQIEQEFVEDVTQRYRRLETQL